MWAASDDPGNETFRGPRAESEPEVQALTSLTDDPNRRFRVQLDYHNYSQLILYPWGYQSGTAPTRPCSRTSPSGCREEILSVRGVTYQPQQAVVLYTTTGTSTDYAYGVNRVAAPFVVEMRPACCGFNIRENEIAVINEENWAGARMMMELGRRASDSRIGQGFSGRARRELHQAGLLGGLDGSRRRMRLTVRDTRFPGLEPGRIMLTLAVLEADGCSARSKGFARAGDSPG